MIAGRRAFFAAGHYQQLADSIAGLISACLPDTNQPVVLDAGCGGGYYLRRLRELLTSQNAGRQNTGKQATLAGLDISRHGIRAAARADPAGQYAVAGTHRIPVEAGRVDVLLSHFSPVSGPDFYRVVRPGGTVLVGGPGEAHLFSLKERVYERATPHEPDPVLAGEPGFDLIKTHRIKYSLTVQGPGQVASLLLMTPYFWSASPSAQAGLAELPELETEVDVIVHAYRRIS